MVTLDIGLERESEDLISQRTLTIDSDTRVQTVGRNCRGFVIDSGRTSLKEIRRRAKKGKVIVSIPEYEGLIRIKCPDAFYQEGDHIKVCIGACISRGCRTNYCSTDYKKCSTVNPEVCDHKNFAPIGLPARHYTTK
jgi:hypothetical protein